MFKFRLCVAVCAVLWSGAAAAYENLAVWEHDLNKAARAAQHQQFSEIALGQLGVARPQVRAEFQALTERAFKGGTFAIDSVSVLSSAPKGQRRLMVLYSGRDYLYLFVVMHLREFGWTAIHFNVASSYSEIKEKF